MKRSVSPRPGTDTGTDIIAKRIKFNDDSVAKNQDYLQLVLDRIAKLQRRFGEDDDYDDEDDEDDDGETSDLGDSASETSTTDDYDDDDDAMKDVLAMVFDDEPLFPAHDELHGFRSCRRLAIDFLANDRNLPNNQNEALRSLDLHLATKERDYADRLLLAAASDK